MAKAIAGVDSLAQLPQEQNRLRLAYAWIAWNLAVTPGHKRQQALRRFAQALAPSHATPKDMAWIEQMLLRGRARAQEVRAKPGPHADRLILAN